MFCSRFRQCKWSSFTFSRRDIALKSLWIRFPWGAPSTHSILPCRPHSRKVYTVGTWLGISHKPKIPRIGREIEQRERAHWQASARASASLALSTASIHISLNGPHASYEVRGTESLFCEQRTSHWQVHDCHWIKSPYVVNSNTFISVAKKQHEKITFPLVLIKFFQETS